MAAGNPIADGDTDARRHDHRLVTHSGVRCVLCRDLATARWHLEAILGHRSWASIESRWRLHILPALGKVPCQQLRPTQVEAMLSALKNDGYAQQQCRHVRATLSASAPV